MFYLTMHSTHFFTVIWGLTYGKGPLNVRGNPISSKGSLYADRITHTMAFVTPVVEHWLEQEIAQWVHHEGSIRLPIAP